MGGKRFKDEQIIEILKEANADVSVQELSRKYGISDATFYNWKSKYSGLTVNEARRIKNGVRPDSYWSSKTLEITRIFYDF